MSEAHAAVPGVVGQTSGRPPRGPSTDVTPSVGRRAFRTVENLLSNPWVFAVPGLLVYGVFLIWPSAQSLWLSLTSWNGRSAEIEFIGLDNYAAMPDDPNFRMAMRNNIIWTIVTVVVPVVLGLLLALLLTGATRAKPLLRTVFYLPAVLPLVGVASIWGGLYNPTNGFVNSLLRTIGLGGLAQSWLGQDSTALAAVMVPAIWVGTGFPMLIYLAALHGIPEEQYESARVDGAGIWAQFWYITMPGLRYAHYIVLALSFISSLKVFDLIFAMTGGGPGRSSQVLGLLMYMNVFSFSRFGYGTALAVVLTAVALVVGIPYAISQAQRSDR